MVKFEIGMLFEGTILAALLLSGDPQVPQEMTCTSQTDPASPTAEEEKDKRCWKDSEEVKNPDKTPRKTPLLAERFERVKVRRSVVVLKLCIDSSGNVARTVVLTSSGNTEVDDFFRSAVSKWTFEPATKDGEPVPSVYTIAVSWTVA